MKKNYVISFFRAIYNDSALAGLFMILCAGLLCLLVGNSDYYPKRQMALVLFLIPPIFFLGMYLGKKVTILDQDKLMLKNWLEIIQNNLTTSKHKKEVAWNILQSPVLDKKAIEVVLENTEANTLENDEALKKLDEYNGIVRIDDED